MVIWRIDWSPTHNYKFKEYRLKNACNFSDMTKTRSESPSTECALGDDRSDRRYPSGLARRPKQESLYRTTAFIDCPIEKLARSPCSKMTAYARRLS
ncbi:hypothetical protein EVAR_46513_1 [Eumeta japonica]|uniref:Uncharacterized protein n=1 Tax=Eumeta variegata TaxID=151549 RepID=A0A4C1WVK7_EUMVA|nr:hypothetical protein EVAR_46513_1 [Eumeta japonica]